MHCWGSWTPCLFTISFQPCAELGFSYTYNAHVVHGLCEMNWQGVLCLPGQNVSAWLVPSPLPLLK